MLDLLLLLLLVLLLLHRLVMVGLRGVQTGGTQQGGALPKQRCHLHPRRLFLSVARGEELRFLSAVLAREEHARCLLRPADNWIA